MNFDEYEDAITHNALYPNKGNNLAYSVLGLNGEAGEVAEKLKKIIRDQAGIISERNKRDIALELGDTLWYLTMCCREIGYNLSEVAHLNIEKIESRRNKGTGSGSGDDR